MDLWLDDLRNPADYGAKGFTWVKTIQEAKAAMLAEAVDQMSLDHDLGACEACMMGRSVDDWLADSNCQSMPHCEHVGTGYQFVLWMAELGFWPSRKPYVHSANAVGRDRMRGVIDRYYSADPAHDRRVSPDPGPGATDSA